jgi:hypothetical protein
MGNYALQKGPCNFLNLRINPWEVPFHFLLCSSSLSALSTPWRLSLSFLFDRRLFQGIFPLPPSLSLSSSTRRLGIQASHGTGRRPGAFQPRAAAARGWRRAGARLASGRGARAAEAAGSGRGGQQCGRSGGCQRRRAGAAARADPDAREPSRRASGGALAGRAGTGAWA